MAKKTFTKAYATETFYDDVYKMTTKWGTLNRGTKNFGLSSGPGPFYSLMMLVG